MARKRSNVGRLLLAIVAQLGVGLAALYVGIFSGWISGVPGTANAAGHYRWAVLSLILAGAFLAGAGGVVWTTRAELREVVGGWLKELIEGL